MKSSKSSCPPVFLIHFSWLPDSLLFSLMNHQLVSIGITKLRHPANRCLCLLDIEAHTPVFELCVRIIKVLHLERDGRSIARRLPRRVRTDPDRGRAKIVLDPRASHLCACGL